MSTSVRRARFALVPLLVLPLAWLTLQDSAATRARSHRHCRARGARLSLVRIDGGEVRLADLRGQPVLVNFWASECIEEHLILTRAQQRYGQRVSGIGGWSSRCC